MRRYVTNVRSQQRKISIKSITPNARGFGGGDNHFFNFHNPVFATGVETLNTLLVGEVQNPRNCVLLGGK